LCAGAGHTASNAGTHDPQTAAVLEVRI
jgi:hypothetical protein